MGRLGRAFAGPRTKYGRCFVFFAIVAVLVSEWSVKSPQPPRIAPISAWGNAPRATSESPRGEGEDYACCPV